LSESSSELGLLEKIARPLLASRYGNYFIAGIINVPHCHDDGAVAGLITKAFAHTFMPCMAWS